MANFYFVWESIIETLCPMDPWVWLPVFRLVQPTLLKSATVADLGGWQIRQTPDVGNLMANRQRCRFGIARHLSRSGSGPARSARDLAK